MEFRRDDRAVSGVIGAVLVLGFLVIFLSIYQASYVPAQNEGVEFDHSQQVQNDMLEVRNAILSADASGETTYSSIKLGTRYPVRVIGINPPPASGTLRTGPPEPVSIVDGGGAPVSNLCPSTGTIQTRTLEYVSGYNEHQSAPTIVYENTVLYLNFSGRSVLLTGQQLVQDDTITIRPLNTSLYEDGVKRIPVESVPGNVNDEEVQNAEITVPTRLSEDAWERLLAGQVDPANVTVANGNLAVQLSGDVAVSCAPIGLNEPPAGGERQQGGVEINPAGPNDVFLESISRNGDTVSIGLNNTAGRDTNITQARMSFYFNEQTPGGQDEVDPYDILNTTTGTVYGDNFVIMDSMQSLDPYIRLSGNKTETTVSFEFDQDGSSDSISQRDFFVVEFRFETGEKATYFVDIP
jgi:FlaG/FlaF family flagellin (archaellin)